MASCRNRVVQKDTKKILGEEKIEMKEIQKRWLKKKIRTYDAAGWRSAVPGDATSPFDLSDFLSSFSDRSVEVEELFELFVATEF